MGLYDGNIRDHRTYHDVHELTKVLEGFRTARIARAVASRVASGAKLSHGFQLKTGDDVRDFRNAAKTQYFKAALRAFAEVVAEFFQKAGFQTSVGDMSMAWLGDPAAFVLPGCSALASFSLMYRKGSWENVAALALTVSRDGKNGSISFRSLAVEGETVRDTTSLEKLVEAESDRAIAAAVVSSL